MVANDKTSIDILRNNVKLMGGIFGAEIEFLQDKQIEDEYFINKS
jgi:hypothetical protein